LISTLVVPALGLSFIMRNWSVVRAKKYERSL
jgi:hypothetical protein